MLNKPTKGEKEISQIATISANNDKVIGDLIADAMEKVGKDGVITVEEAKGVGDHPGSENNGPFGFNAETEEYEDLVVAGIIDPTKVRSVGAGERRQHCRPDGDDRVSGGGGLGEREEASNSASAGRLLIDGGGGRMTPPLDAPVTS